MHEIKITYRRWWRERTIVTSFPESWSEMTARQFRTLFARPDDVSLLAIMLGVKRRIVKRFSLVQIYELSRLFDFIRRDRKVSDFRIKDFHCPGIGKLFAPQAKLAEMTFEQFIYIDTYYMAYVRSGSREDLCRLIAYMYSFGEFSKELAERNVKRLKKVDTALLEAIALNYGLVRKWIAERYPLVFPVGKQSGKATNGSWPDVFDNIVGDDLKDRDKYGRVPVNSVFKFITRKIKESRKNGAKI